MVSPLETSALPHDPKAEKHALSLILRLIFEANETEARACMGLLDAGYFHLSGNHAVFHALQNCFHTETLPSVEPLINHLENQGMLKDEALELINGLKDANPDINSDFNSVRVRLETVQKRRLLGIAGRQAVRLSSDENLKGGQLTDAVRTLVDMVLVSKADKPSKKLLNFHSQASIRSWVAPDDLFLVGQGLITRGEVILIGGAPGIGKSRAALALAVSGATGRDWFGLPVRNRFRTLIIQCENGRHRLKSDFDALADAGIDLADAVMVTDCPDVGLKFACPAFRAEVKAEIERFKPSVVVVDPWTEATQGDKKEDYQNALANIRSCLPKGDNAPALIIVCHTRKPQGEEKTSGRGLLNLIAGSYTIGSAARTAFVIQKASDEPDDTRRVWTCCKANNCEMPPATAWDCSIASFEPLPDFDWTSFQAGGKTSGRPAKVSEEDIRTVLADGRRAAKKVVVDELMENCDCVASNAYEALKRCSHLLDTDENRLLYLKS
ncbi:MAG TPA: AAA family ATPase [Verrucomicrobiae bacterium]